MLGAYFNPYANTNFFSFFGVLFQRVFQWLTGTEGMQLTSDEIQMLVLIGVALSSALVGSFLVLRRMTMLANALSHTILLGIVFAYVISRGLDAHADHALNLHFNLEVLLAASVLTGILTAYLTEFLTRTARLQEEASTGLVFTSLFALGIVFVTMLTRNVHIGAEVVMGNVDALHQDDIRMVYLIFIGNLALILLFFKEYTLTTFDGGLARSLGFSVAFFNYLLMTQVAMTTIGAFRAVGVLLVLAFITGPVLAARLLTYNLKAMLGLACGLGALASMVGVALSRHLLSVYGLALSTGGIVVCVIFLFFLAAMALVTFRTRVTVNDKS